MGLPLGIRFYMSGQKSEVCSMSMAQPFRHSGQLGLGFLLLFLLCLGVGGLIRYHYSTAMLSDREIVERYFGDQGAIYDERPVISVNCPQFLGQVIPRLCYRVIGLITRLIPVQGRIVALDLTARQLSTLPLEIGQLTKLGRLDLSDNGLTNLPPEIGQLTRLGWLDLSDNRLATLPPETGQLTNVRKLDLSDNGLTVLPSEIAQLTRLGRLDLSGNALTALPPEIAQLTNLKELDLSGNRLTTLPPEIGQLPNLRKLHLSDNPITTLPPEIEQLRGLEVHR
jgi:hypothetical protein